jgi:hypothetical protein
MTPIQIFQEDFLIIAKLRKVLNAKGPSCQALAGLVGSDQTVCLLGLIPGTLRVNTTPKCLALNLDHPREAHHDHQAFQAALRAGSGNGRLKWWMAIRNHPRHIQNLLVRNQTKEIILSLHLNINIEANAFLYL